jgi:PAS domain S-box-containing protein
MNRLGGILDRAHDLVLTACPIAGMITYANRSARDKLALDFVASLGLTISSVMPHLDLETIRSLCIRRSERRTSPPIATEFLRHGRVPIPVEVVFQMIDGLQAGSDTVVVIARDIGARREMEEVRQDLISTLSHELRTPLSSLHAALDIVVHDLPIDLLPEARQMPEVAPRSSGRLVSLMNDLLDISRIEAGVLDLQPAPHDLLAPLRDAIDTANPLALASGASLVIADDGGHLLSVMVDADRFLQIIGNLLNNAIKFSAAGTMVEVEIESCLNRVEIRVFDHGCGVAPEFLPLLFTKFARDHHGSRPGGAMNGTGLGLPIARALVAAVKGTLHHENAPGAGPHLFSKCLAPDDRRHR